MMKITCSEAEKEWLEKLMIESDNCGLHCPCELLDRVNTDICKQCIEKNVRFEREAEE